MKNIKINKVVSMVLFFALLLLVSKVSEAAPILQDEMTTVFDHRTGELVKEPELPKDKNIVRLAYQGGSDLYKDVKVGGIPIRKFPVEVRAGQIVTVEKVGSFYGEEIKFGLKSKSGFYLDFDEGGLAVSSLKEGKQNVTDLFEFWVEDSKGKIINDKNTLFLLSTTSKRNSSVLSYETIYMNPDPEVYLVAADNISYLELSKMIDTTSTITIKTDGNYASANQPINYSYGFKSLGQSINVQRNMSSEALSRVTDIFLSPNNPVGVELPYQPPKVVSTISENWPNAEVKVSQEVINQGYDIHYPKSLDIVIDPDSVLDLSQIKASEVDVTSSNGIPITNHKVSFPKTGANKGKIVISLPKSTLVELKDTNVMTTINIPIKLDEPNLKNYLVNGMIQPTIKAHNNKAFNSSKLPIISENVINVKVPLPTGEPILGKIVYQNSHSSELEASELVDQLASEFPNDSVEIVRVIDNREFFDVGEESIKVKIRSLETKITNEITVPITVISRGLNILEPMEIIPVKQQIATGKEDLIYYPTIKQKISMVPDASETLMDNLKLTIVYTHFINISEMTFDVRADGKVLDESWYTAVLEGENTYNFIFTNEIINNELLGKEISIKHNAPIARNNEKIMDIYKKETNEFVFPIKAYHSYTEKNKPLVFTQAPKTEEIQVISYQPEIQAESIDKKEVLIGSAPEEPESYIKKISDLDFEFDSYDYYFENEPDFSNVGKKEFIVMAASKNFGHKIKIPVEVEVDHPKSEMSVKQVYKGHLDKPIYSELVSKKTVDNSKNKKKYHVGAPLQPILKEFIENEPDFQFIFDWYEQTPYDQYIVLIDGKQVITDTVPEEDFEVIYEYEGILKITASDLDFGDIMVTGNNHSIHPLRTERPDHNKDMELINTTLNPYWKIKVSSIVDLHIVDTEEKYLGGLEFTRENETEPVEITNNSSVFAERLDTNNDLKTIIPMSIVLYQNTGNMIGDYTGKILWTLENTP